MANSPKQVKDFIIESGIKSVLERSHCEVKHGRTVEDFIEYVKFEANKIISDDRSTRIHYNEEIVKFFSSDKEFGFELRRELESLKTQIKDLEDEAV